MSLSRVEHKVDFTDGRTSALRELHEETGYGSGKAAEGNAEVWEVSSVLVKDPG